MPPDEERSRRWNSENWEFTKGRYDLSVGEAKKRVVRKVQFLLRKDFNRNLKVKQVQMIWSDLKRRDKELVKSIQEALSSGSASRPPAPPAQQRPARRQDRRTPPSAQPQDLQEGDAPGPSTSRSSSPGPSFHSQRVARRSAGCLQTVPLSTHLKLRRDHRRLKATVRRHQRGVPVRDFRILKQQVLELREKSAKQDELIANLMGTGGRRDA
ncbi:uncharacterized protein [Hyperolius riggenbachi]|uniref:uncharacterized protein n=1 Tax=Hyperolius riggenbachi TaxID=752182 RepID=UPI0035A2A2DC